MKLNYLSINHLSEKKLSLPEPDTMDICIFSLADFPSIADSKHILSAKEQEKSSSLRQETDRICFTASRILLRRLLGLYLDFPAECLLFKTGPHGKPGLFFEENKDALPKIRFNLSHSGGYIALAFSAFFPVGIDIENIRENARIEPLVRRFFHPDEYKAFLKLDPSARQDFFFRRWTVREAFLKGIGTGLTMSPDSFCVEETSGSSPLFHIEKGQEDYSSWQIMPVPAADGYYCSAAYQLPGR